LKTVSLECIIRVGFVPIARPLFFVLLILRPYLIALSLAWGLSLTGSSAEEPATDTAPPKSYPVRVVRPLKVGSIFSYAALGATHEHTLVTWSGSTLDEVKKFQQCELAATAEVTEVDTEGMPVRTLYRVHRCKGRDENLKEIELVPKDTEIEVFSDAAGLHFRIDGQPITQELHASLSLVLAKPVPDDEQLFGSKRPRSPGESWPVDSTLAAKRFAEKGIAVDPARLGAKVTFTRVAPPASGSAQSAGECMDLAVEMKAPDAGPALPEGFQIRSGSLEVNLGGRFPLNPALPPLDEESEFLLQTEASGTQDGAQLDLRVEISRNFRARRVLFTSP
jgi:hypothetical protein